MSSEGALRLFSIPVYTGMLPGFAERQAGLAGVVRGLAAAAPGISASNRHGWHSERNLHLSDHADLKWIREQVELKAAAWLGKPGEQPRHRVAALWAMVLGDGGWSAPHQHAPWPWSGVVYIEAQSASAVAASDSAGKLELMNPVPLAEQFGLASGAMISPRDGQIVLFPGVLQHFVHPVRGGEQRISLSFNLQAT